MSDMYTKHAKRYDAVAQSNIYNALLERPSTIALLSPLSEKTVLDMGCGSGIYAQYFLTHNVNYLTCIDASSEMIELVKAKHGSNVNAYVQDLSQGLPQEPDNLYDAIICPLVLHYLEDLPALFQEAYRVLKKGGYMVFSMHHPFADFECSVTGNYYEREQIEEEWDTVGEPVTVRFYRRSLTEITEALNAAGFVISRLTEGVVAKEAKQISPETYERLSRNPNFIFIRCEKR
ncbi:class I SAM-dependent DNA methyltransferase [Photobacterium damselae]|nr:class I SAM-dependent methyltransferase [Photobacterium damselae]MCG3845043.1 methyltransferase domain-containing protein [Photobacterium damselae]